MVPLINIVFEEMEVPELMALPSAQLTAIFERAFLLKDYRYGYPQTFVHVGEAGVDGILVGYPHAAEAHIDDAFAPLLPELGMAPDQELFPDTETAAGEWYVDTLAVAPSAQGHGVGTALLTGVEALLRARGERLLSLNVDQTNPRAEQLYRKVGYTKAGELMIGSHRYNHMVKAL